MRLIDIDDVMISERNPDVFRVPETAYGWNECLEIFRNAPAVDAVPVVRCKDCLRWKRDAYGGVCDRYGVRLDGDWFCAGGEKKEVQHDD